MQHKTRTQLFDYLGVRSDMSLSRLTQGNPTADRLEKMADFFDMPVDVFFKRKLSPVNPKELEEALRALSAMQGQEE